MQYDKPLMAALYGCISTIIYEIFTRILLFFGIGKYSLYQLDSFVVTLDRSITIIGIVVSFSVSCFISNLLYYATKKMGYDYFITKSIVISIMLWVILEAIFTATIEGRSIPARPVSDYYIHLSGTVVYGITQGLLLKKFLIKSSKRQIA